MKSLSFEAEVVYWRGPSPYFFAPTPIAIAEAIRATSRLVSYGWGMIPVDVAIGEVVFTTSLFPKDETFFLPLKAEIRRKTGVTAGDVVSVTLTPRFPETPARGAPFA